MITAVTHPVQTFQSAPIATTAGVTAAAAAIAPMATADIISQTLMTMSANPYIIGAFYLLMNLGGRFLSLELTKKQEVKTKKRIGISADILQFGGENGLLPR